MQPAHHCIVLCSADTGHARYNRTRTEPFDAVLVGTGIRSHGRVGRSIKAGSDSKGYNDKSLVLSTKLSQVSP